MKVTTDLGAEIYRAVKVEAARADRSVRDVVEEALEAWLRAAEDAEDRASANPTVVLKVARRSDSRSPGRSVTSAAR